MNIIERRLENARFELQIEVPESQIELEYKSVFEKLKKNAEINGFRKGKVPIELVMRKYRNVADREVAENILKSTYRDAIKEKELSPVTLPEFEFDKIERGKSFTYRVKFDVTPTVELGEYKNFEVEERNCEIVDEDVDSEIEALRVKNASISEKEDGGHIEKGDLAKIQVKRIDNVENDDIEKVKFDELTLIIGKGDSKYTFDKYITGMKVDEEKEVVIRYPKDYKIEDLAGQKVKYLVKIIEINNLSLPNLDDEFAKDLGDYSSLKDLKDKIRENLESFIKEKVKNKVKNELLRRVVESCKFEVPESMVKREMEAIIRRIQVSMGSPGKDIDDLVKDFRMDKDEFYKKINEEAIYNIKSTLALSEVAKREDLKVSESRYREYIENIAKSQNRSIEEIREITEGNNARRSIESELILGDATEFLYNNAHIKKQQPVSLNEFMKW